MKVIRTCSQCKCDMIKIEGGLKCPECNGVVLRKPIDLSTEHRCPNCKNRMERAEYNDRAGCSTWECKNCNQGVDNDANKENQANIRFDKWNRELIPCKVCTVDTPMLGTELCDPCWEATTRIERFIGQKCGRDWTLKALGITTTVEQIHGKKLEETPLYIDEPTDPEALRKIADLLKNTRLDPQLTEGGSKIMSGSLVFVDPTKRTVVSLDHLKEYEEVKEQHKKIVGLVDEGHEAVKDGRWSNPSWIKYWLFQLAVNTGYEPTKRQATPKPTPDKHNPNGCSRCGKRYDNEGEYYCKACRTEYKKLNGVPR